MAFPHSAAPSPSAYLRCCAAFSDEAFLQHRQQFAHLTDEPDTTLVVDQTLTPTAIVTTFNEQVFATLFWFMLLGPFSAWTYYSVVQLHRLATSTAEVDNLFARYETLSTQILALLMWLPARLVACGYMLAGDFSAGMRQLQQRFLTGPDDNQRLLLDVALAASGKAEASPSAQTAEALFVLSDRCLILLLALYAMIALI